MPGGDSGGFSPSDRMAIPPGGASAPGAPPSY